MMSKDVGLSRFLGGANSNSDVYKLTPDELKKLQEKNDKIVFVKFYMPGCGWCKKMAKDWIALAKKNTKDTVVIAEYDATESPEHQNLSSSLGVKGFPTIILYKNGKKIEYNGERTVNDWMTFLNNHC